MQKWLYLSDTDYGSIADTNPPSLKSLIDELIDGWDVAVNYKWGFNCGCRTRVDKSGHIAEQQIYVY